MTSSSSSFAERARAAVLSQDLKALSALSDEARRHRAGPDEEERRFPYSLTCRAAQQHWEAGVEVLVRCSSSSVVASALFHLLKPAKQGGADALRALELVLRRADGKAQAQITERLSTTHDERIAEMLDRTWDDLHLGARQRALSQLARSGAWAQYRERRIDTPMETDALQLRLLLAMVKQADTVPLELFQAAYDAAPAYHQQIFKEAAREGHNRLVAWMCEHTWHDEGVLAEATYMAARYEHLHTVALLLQRVRVEAVVERYTWPDQLYAVDAMGCAAKTEDRARLLARLPGQLPRTEAYHVAEQRDLSAQTAVPKATRSARARS